VPTEPQAVNGDSGFADFLALGRCLFPGAAAAAAALSAESQALIGDNGFADVLPLAAAGPGEPLGTAAAVLGLMAMWRSFYAVYLDTWVWASAR
jgi:hypothetical protein